MSPEELAAARNWSIEEKWSKLSPYGRAVVTKLIDEIIRLQKKLEWYEEPTPVQITVQMTPEERQALEDTWNEAIQ